MKKQEREIIVYYIFKWDKTQINIKISNIKKEGGERSWLDSSSPSGDGVLCLGIAKK